MRVAARLLLLVIVAGVSGHALAARPAAQERPRVRLIATGGTISNQAGGRLSADQLLALVPDLEEVAVLEAEQFANVASSSLTLTQWLALATRINRLFESDPGLAGVVVTSGTDTLEETAYFLHLTVRDIRPVVLVGSMRNPSTLGYEGPANLLQAVRVAAEPASRGQGVLVVLNDEINSAREVTKTHSLRLHTFQTRGYGLLGTVDRDRVVYHRALVQRHTADSEFEVASIGSLPRVDVIMVYQGAPGDLITAAVDAGASGLVIAAAGAGALSGSQRAALLHAYRSGVVVSTRTGAGRIIPRTPRGAGEPLSEARALEQRFRIAGEDLAPLKARILLMLALTVTDDADVVRRMFREY